MTYIKGLMFFFVLIVIIILIITIKTVYDIWATSITLKLFRNNQGNYSMSRILIWILIIISIGFILNILSKKQKNSV
jgi:hypothetical protein